MKRNLYLLLLLSNVVFAQSEKPVRKWYSMSATEFILSSGNVKSDSISFDPVARFSAFLHLQGQSHFNFTNRVGIYTGLGSRNVGFINKFEYKGDDVTIKKRSYSLGVPLAIKFGNVVRNKFIAIGGELEWMFSYKRKIFYQSEKSRKTEWFSNQVNPLNPSVFAEIHFSKHSFIKGKYYLNDFLQDRDMSFYIPGTGAQQYYKPTSSKMFYISIGTTFKNPEKKSVLRRKRCN